MFPRPLLFLSLLLPLLFSAPTLQIDKNFNSTGFAQDNIKEFSSRGEYGVAFQVPDNINQRRFLGVTRDAATKMVNRFIKQSIEASGGKLFKV